MGIPKFVILPGKSSHMPWLQKLVKDVFAESTVYRDTEPSYVVSDGLAYCGLAIHVSKMDCAKEEPKEQIQLTKF